MREYRGSCVLGGLVQAPEAQTISQIVDLSVGYDGPIWLSRGRVRGRLGCVPRQRQRVWHCAERFALRQAGTIEEIIYETGDGAGKPLDGNCAIAVDGSGGIYVTGQSSDNAFRSTLGGAITKVIDATADGTGKLLDAPCRGRRSQLRERVRFGQYQFQRIKDNSRWCHHKDHRDNGR